MGRFFFLSDSSIDSAAEVVSSYICFCVDMTINTKQIRYFGNDKPWVSKQLKALLHKKRDALKQNDKAKVKAIQRDIDKQITADRQSYKPKLEDTFKGNDPRLCWKGVETITGHKARESQLHTGDNARLAEELNSFYTRFDKYDFSAHQKEVMEEVRCRPSEPVKISQEAVRNCVLKVKISQEAVRNCVLKVKTHSAVRNCVLKVKTHSAVRNCVLKVKTHSAVRNCVLKVKTHSEELCPEGEDPQ